MTISIDHLGLNLSSFVQLAEKSPPRQKHGRYALLQTSFSLAQISSYTGAFLRDDLSINALLVSVLLVQYFPEGTAQ